jgi:hypothetical protein
METSIPTVSKKARKRRRIRENRKEKVAGNKRKTMGQ